MHCLRPSKQKEGQMMPPIEDYTLQGQGPLNFMGYQKCIKKGEGRQKPFDLAHSCCKRKNNISSKHLKSASTQHGPWTEWRSRARHPPRTSIEVITNMLDITTQTTRIYTWWFHITKGSVKASKDHAEIWGTSALQRRTYQWVHLKDQISTD